MVTGPLMAAGSIPAGLALQCPANNWKYVSAVKKCEDCEHFKGILQVTNETIPEDAPWEVRHRISCAAPIARSGMIIEV